MSGELDETGNFLNARRTLEWIGTPDPATALGDLWDMAYGLVATEWQGLQRVAKVLLERQSMDGEEFEAA